jgi:hypothetical protein
MRKYKCSECGDISLDKEILKAPNPFDSEEICWGCPTCKSIDQFEDVCDELVCTEVSTCGFPSKYGYRRTCGKHYREATKRK